MYNYDDRPIIACSTGCRENAAIALIRLSGFKDLSSLSPFFSAKLFQLKPRLATTTSLLKDGRVLDNVVITYFQGPKSYNGEHILEIAAHGNQINVRRIINTFLEKGICREAMPGEFTMRALKNKKLSLSQVEGLDLLLNAQSGLALDSGLDSLHGELNTYYRELHRYYTQAKIAIELLIDFSEDIGEEVAWEKLRESAKGLETLAHMLAVRSSIDASSLLTPQVTFFGPPNAGKSTLFNRLLGHERSIVSPKAGTTRDYVSEHVSWGELQVRLVDTAGVREIGGEVEAEGIKRSYQVLAPSFFKVLLLNPFDVSKEYVERELKDMTFDLLAIGHADTGDWKTALSKFAHLPFAKNVIVADFLHSGPIGPVSEDECGPIGPLMKKGGPIGPSKTLTGPIGPRFYSQFPKPGPIGPAGDLESLIQKLAEEKYKELTEGRPILIERHRNLIRRIDSKNKNFQHVMSSSKDLGVLDMALLEVGHEISELIGMITPDTILASIFENFCIGK